MSASVVLPSPATLARNRFRVGMKLEALDRRYPYYVCVATIMDRQGMCAYNEREREREREKQKQRGERKKLGG